MTDDHKYTTGIRTHGRSGGKRDFVGGKPCRFTVLLCQPIAALRRLARLLGLQPDNRTSQRELARMIAEKEGQQ